jgi:hypothetical protein
MIKVVSLFKRKEGMTAEEFRDYYENTHCKIFEKYLQTPGVRRYVRRYLRPNPDPITGESRSSGFDVIMEAWFDSEEFYNHYFHGDLDSVFRKIVAEDEKNLFDRSQMFFHIVDEYDTKLPHGVETYGSRVV